MGTPGGGRTYITPRMTRHFNIIGYTELEQGIVRHIFTTLSSSFLKRMNDDVKEIIPKMVDSLLLAYDEIKTVFLPTPAKCHYLFNLRDISKVI
jgi:dynein heavy chain